MRKYSRIKRNQRLFMQNYYNTFCIICIFVVLLISNDIFPQDASLKIHYNFENSTTEKNIKDCSGNGCDATLCNGAIIKKMGKFSVLDLGIENGYVDLGKKTGQIIQSLNDFTISVNVFIDSSVNLNSNNGNHIWSFAKSDLKSVRDGYIGLSAINTYYIISKSDWKNRNGVNRGVSLPKDSWVNITYTQKDSIGTIYINAEKIKSEKVLIKPSNVGITTNNYIGKSFNIENIYLKNSLISDFRLYNRAIKETEIKTLASQAEELNNVLAIQQINNAKMKLEIHNLDKVFADMKLPTICENNVEITWQSLNTNIISNSGVIKRPETGTQIAEVRLIATFCKYNLKESKEFIIHVLPYFVI